MDNSPSCGQPGDRPLSTLRRTVTALDARSSRYRRGRAEVTWLAEQLRDYGREHGIVEFTEAEVPFGELPGAPTEPAQVASLMMEAAKAVMKRWTGYQGPVGGGTRIGMLIEHPSFVLPAPADPRVSRVLQQGLAELRFSDQRRGFRSYAINRGLRLRENDTQMLMGGTR